MIAREQESNQRSLDLIDEENLSLLSAFPKPSIEADVKDNRKKVFINTLSFGLNGLFFAAYNVSNGKLISMLGEESSGASGVVTMYLSVILGGSIGLLFGTGLDMGRHITKNEFLKAGEVAKASWIFASGLGVLSSGLMLATRGIFPKLFEAHTAQTAIDFFKGSAIGNVPMLMLVSGSQICFQEGDWLMPPAIGFALFTLATSIGYLLAFKGDLGAFGIGLGSSLAQIIVCLGTQAWFLRADYKKYALYQLSALSSLTTRIHNLWSEGWKISIQRLSEWVNLMLITTILGMESNYSLEAASPSVEYVRILAAVMQGVAQAAGMMVVQNKTRMDKFLKEDKYEEAKEVCNNNVRLVIQTNVSAGLVSGLIGGSFYLARKPLTKFFLASDPSSEIVEFAGTLLWINMLGFISDAVRLTSTGGLRGWKDTLYPAIISVLIMIVLAVPAGWALGEVVDGHSDETSKAAMLFYARNIATLFAAVLMIDRCRKQISSNFTKISTSAHSFFNKTVQGNTDNVSHEPYVAVVLRR